MTYIPGRNTRGDSTPAGKARWERAARNALLRPHSVAAQIYRKRYDLALQIAEAGRMVSKDGPFEHVAWVQDQSAGTERPYPLVLKRQATVCSMFCAAMHAQIGYFRDAVTLADKFKAPERVAIHSAYMRRLDTSTLKRKKADCRVCGRTVKK